MDEDSEEWNMARAFYQRLDEILTTCTIAQIKGDGMMWYKGLYRLYVEIQAKMNDAQKKKAGDMLERITKLKINALQKRISVDTKELVEFELYLRQILEDRNMLTPRKDISGL